jgi:hypothetical protein
MDVTNVLPLRPWRSHIVGCSNVSYSIAEKQALVLASGHPFITTLYSCFQTKVICNFLEPAGYFQTVINTEIYSQYENVMFRCICKIVKMDYELHHVCLSMWNNSDPTARIFIKFECIKFNENLSKICQSNLSFSKLW